MNKNIINLYKRKIIIANIISFLILTFIYFISNRFKATQVNIIFLLAFLFIFIISNIAKVDGTIYMIFPSMKELNKLESVPWKEEVKIKSKTSLAFAVIFLNRVLNKNKMDFSMDFKMYLILLIIGLIIINIGLREEYKSIFYYSKNK